VYAPRQKARFRLKLLLASIDAHGLVLDDVQCDEVEVIGEYRSGGNEKTHGAESEDEALVCEGEGGAQEACESHQDDEDEPGPAKSIFLTGERKQKQPSRPHSARCRELPAN